MRKTYVLISGLVCLFIIPTSYARVGWVETWLTTRNKSSLLEKQKPPVSLTTRGEGLPLIEIKALRHFQVIDGFGFTLTGGSAFVINRMTPTGKSKLLHELFGKDANSLSLSYLRLSIGASDLNFAPFSYNDLPAGETDTDLARFSLGEDEKEVIPLLREIKRINPRLQILGTPWSAPPWMKDNGSFTGGHLAPKYYDVYARYLVKYVSEMARRGIGINALTPQNEPLHPGNNPSMVMNAAEQAEFVKSHLGPALRKARLKTKIIIYDHNCDKPEYPVAVLNDAAAKPFIDGTAFHLYAGEISAMSRVHQAHPDKNLYFTEQYTSSRGDFGGDLNWHLKNVVIGALRNWSKVVLEWNLASDPAFKPHTPGGCDTCLGALTIAQNTVTRNVSYYIIGHASKFVPPGSLRIDSNIAGPINNVAFHTPNGNIVLIAQNDSKETVAFNIRYGSRAAQAMLPGGAVGTFIWK